MKQSVVVLWTGGKDSCLALYRCKEMGHEIKALATFVPENLSEFKAHPREIMLKQAEQLGLPIHFIQIEAPYKESYIEALKWIKDKLSASAVATGDIDLVAGLPNWIQECCEEAGLDCLRPLWRKSRGILMDEILRRKIRAKITWINHPSIPSHWINQEIDEALLKEMKELSRMTGIDLAGENGEYHTMVIGPLDLIDTAT